MTESIASRRFQQAQPVFNIVQDEAVEKELRKHFFDTLGRIELLPPMPGRGGVVMHPFTFAARAEEKVAIVQALVDTMENLNNTIDTNKELSEAARIQLTKQVIELTDAYAAMQLDSITQLKKAYKKNPTINMFQATHDVAAMDHNIATLPKTHAIYTFYNELSRKPELLAHLAELVATKKIRSICAFIKKHVKITSIAVMSTEKDSEPVYYFLDKE